MLDESQQPLPAELRSALQDALDACGAGAFARVVELAATSGYV
jgi:hypothetical protein